MDLLGDAWHWILQGAPGAGFGSLGGSVLTHLLYTLISVAIAVAFCTPLGWWIGHTGRGRDLAVAMAGAARAVPSFGLMLLLVLLLGVIHKPEAAVITFVLLAAPSILAGAYSGFEAIDRTIIDAGTALGMSGWQMLWRVEIPLGLPLLVAGIRAAVLQVIATVTLAAYLNLGGLGQYIITGLPLRRFDMVIGGAVLVAGLALLVDGLFAGLQRLSVPLGIRTGKSNV
jgi:osmoprotectant transport system permease protein